ncbi:hypothetical protein [Streptodolium elevatio]
MRGPTANGAGTFSVGADQVAPPSVDRITWVKPSVAVSKCMPICSVPSARGTSRVPMARLLVGTSYALLVIHVRPSSVDLAR